MPRYSATLATSCQHTVPLEVEGTSLLLPDAPETGKPHKKLMVMSLSHTDTKSNSKEICEEGHSSLGGADISVTVDTVRIIYKLRDYHYLITAKFKTTSSGTFAFFHFIFIHRKFNAVCASTGKY